MKCKITIIFLAISIISCGQVPFSRLGNGSSLNVSFVGTSSDSSRAVISKAIGEVNSNLGDENFIDTLKDDVRGNLIDRYTPQNFIISINGIHLYNSDQVAYNPSDNLTATVLKMIDRIKTPTDLEGEYEDAVVPFDYGNVELPQHYDLVYAKNIIRDFEPSDYIWQGVHVEAGGFGSEYQYDNGEYSYRRNIITVDLGSEYESTNLQNEIVALKNGTLHSFYYENLNPYVISGSWLFFDSKAEEAIVAQTVPYSDDSSGNELLVFPRDLIDLSEFSDPVATFYWDMNDLIEIYDNGTPLDLDDDLVTFNLSNPYPIELFIEENSADVIDPTDSTAPGEVLWPGLTRNEYGINTLIWVNPQNIDFKQTIIVRKEGSAPSDIDDGEIIYQGYYPCYVDSHFSNIEYYYSIFTEDFSGNISDGVDF